MGRYERNFPAISLEEQAVLAEKRVLVAGCGGLGGYIVEFLGRAGVGHLTVVDGDTFVESNLNRQLYSTVKTLGRPKPECAAERMRDVNPLIKVEPVCQNITPENAAAILAGHDVIVDALDSGRARITLSRAARELKIPLVSGAVGGWRGRVFVLFPGDQADWLWEGGAPSPPGNPCFTVSCVASVEAAEAIKLLLGRQGVLRNRVLEIDLLNGRWEEIPALFSDS